ncbi:MAG: hypothetical protein RTU63_07570 [Candidatus Thorarchaeota archaeon]
MSKNKDSRIFDKNQLLCIYVILIFVVIVNYPLLDGSIFADAILAVVVLVGILVSALYLCLASFDDEREMAKDLRESADL